MTEKSEYNGHPSYEHWNASLWISNCEDWYGDAVRFGAEKFASVYEGAQTGDGVTLTRTLLLYAWRCVNPPQYEVMNIHGGTDYGIFLAEADSDPGWWMSLEDAREVCRESGRRWFEFLDEVYQDDEEDAGPTEVD